MYTWDKRVIVERSRAILKLRGMKTTSGQTSSEKYSQETQTYDMDEIAVGQNINQEAGTEYSLEDHV